MGSSAESADSAKSDKPSLEDGFPRGGIKWANCKGCGKRVLFAEAVKDDGSTGIVCLDPVPAMYHVVYNEDGSALARRATRNRVMVSHFNTCPNASDFGKKKA